MASLTAEHIETEIEAEGFTALGWFKVKPEDGVPDSCCGCPASAVVMVGNAGPEMWLRFAEACDPDYDTLDAWTEAVLSELAVRLGADAHFPFAKPPLPFLRWAGRSGFAHTSPLGMSIHPKYGLWHAYRAALAFPVEIDLPDASASVSPCEACESKPCLSTCPVGAFTGTSYDVPVCATHMATPDGSDCLELGCRARRACPVGREFTYDPRQAHFHMSAFLRARLQDGLNPAES